MTQIIMDEKDTAIDTLEGYFNIVAFAYVIRILRNEILIFKLTPVKRIEPREIIRFKLYPVTEKGKNPAYGKKKRYEYKNKQWRLKED